MAKVIKGNLIFFSPLISAAILAVSILPSLAKPEPGVYVVGRDLAGVAVIGTHQFIVLVPEDSSKFPTTRDLGDGTQGIVVGTHNKGHLKVVPFETSDYQAIKEYSNPQKYVSWYKPDLDAEVHKVNIGSLEIDSAIQKTLKSIDYYTSYEDVNNHEYPSDKETLANDSTLLNSNSWAQSLIEYNFGAGKVVEDFKGKDSGHQNRFSKAYFLP